MSYLIQTQLLRQSEHKKQWNIRGVNILVQNTNKILLEIQKENEKSNFDFYKIWNMRISAAADCPDYQDKEYDFQFFLEIFVDEKVIVFGTLEMQDDLLFIGTLYCAYLLSISMQNDFFVDQILRPLNITLQPRITFENSQTIINYISQMVYYVNKYVTMKPAFSYQKYVFSLQKMFYVATKYIVMLNITSQLDFNCFPPSFPDQIVLKIIISEKIDSPLAMVNNDMYVNSEQILRIIYKTTLNQLNLPLPLRFLHCSAFAQIQTLEEYLYYLNQSLHKTLLQNPVMIQQFHIAFPGPFVQLVFKTALLAKASSQTLQNLQQAYDQIYQTLTDNNTNSLNFDIEQFPSFVYMPLNNAQFPRMNEIRPVFNGFARIFQNGKLSAPLEMTCFDKFIPYLQEINGILINGSLLSYVLVALVYIQKHRGFDKMFKYLKFSIQKDQSIKSDPNSLQLLLCHSERADVICDIYQVVLLLEINLINCSCVLKIFIERAENTQFLPESTQKGEREYEPRIQKDAEEFAPQSSTNTSITRLKLNRKQQTVLQKLSKLSESSDQQKNSQKSNKKIKIGAEQIHINEILEKTECGGSWEEPLMKYFVSKIAKAVLLQIQEKFTHLMKNDFNLILQNLRKCKINSQNSTKSQNRSQLRLSTIFRKSSDGNDLLLQENYQSDKSLLDSFEVKLKNLSIELQIDFKDIAVELRLLVIIKLFLPIVQIVKEIQQKVAIKKVIIKKAAQFRFIKLQEDVLTLYIILVQPFTTFSQNDTYPLFNLLEHELAFQIISDYNVLTLTKTEIEQKGKIQLIQKQLIIDEINEITYQGKHDQH